MLSYVNWSIAKVQDIKFLTFTYYKLFEASEGFHLLQVVRS